MSFQKVEYPRKEFGRVRHEIIEERDEHLPFGELPFPTSQVFHIRRIADNNRKRDDLVQFARSEIIGGLPQILGNVVHGTGPSPRDRVTQDLMARKRMEIIRTLRAEVEAKHRIEILDLKILKAVKETSKGR